MKKRLIATLLAGVSVSAMAEDIRFATEASYPPFEFMDAANTIQGFDIDLANALCAEMQANCTFTNQAFDSLIPSLRFRRFEAVIAGMDITPERLKQVLFTHPYYDNSAVFISNKDKFSDVATLKGQRIGIQNGTTHQKYLLEKHPEMTVVAYDSYQNAILDLKNGRINAVFGDTAVVNEWLKSDKELTSIGDKITDQNYFGSGLAIAVRQSNNELINRFNNALKTIKENGTYQTIYNKWFD